MEVRTFLKWNEKNYCRTSKCQTKWSHFEVLFCSIVNGFTFQPLTLVNYFSWTNAHYCLDEYPSLKLFFKHVFLEWLFPSLIAVRFNIEFFSFSFLCVCFGVLFFVFFFFFFGWGGRNRSWLSRNPPTPLDYLFGSQLKCTKLHHIKGALKLNNSTNLNSYHLMLEHLTLEQ